MKILNLGCGANRPPWDAWINLDSVRSVLAPGTKERVNLDQEKNYIDHDLLNPLPFEANTIDAILCSHVLEHFTVIESLKVLRDCYRVLRPGGLIRVSVPCPERFITLTLAGEEGWGVTDWNEKNTLKTAGVSYMEAALLHWEHKQILGYDALRCLFWLAKFQNCVKKSIGESAMPVLADADNRGMTSLFVEGVK